jgi:hypothetical protein
MNMVHLPGSGAVQRQLFLVVLVASLTICSMLPVSHAFVPLSKKRARRSVPTNADPFRIIHHQTASFTKLSMARNDDGIGLLPTLGVIAITILFVATSFLPPVNLGGGGGAPANIADSVVTKQDNPEKFKNFENKFDKLSRATIQDKLNAVPVFYLVDSDGSMQTNIFLSYQDASIAAGGSAIVKATTLDQVM